MGELHRLEKRILDLPESLWATITSIDELKGQWIAGAKLSPQALGRLKKSALFTSTGASTRIEGARLSDEDVEKLMKGLAVHRFRDRDVQEVRGYFSLLQNVFDTWRSIQFSENTIKHFHKELLRYVEKDQHHLGEYKTTDNKVAAMDPEGNVITTIFDTTPPYLVPSEMNTIISWASQALKDRTHHPLLVMGNFVVEFLKIHPFQDGNGRLSRVLTTLLLLKAGYLYVPYVSHEKIIEDHKADYYLALRRSQQSFTTDTEDITSWLTFFLSVVLKQSKLAIALLSQEHIEKLLSPKQLAVWTYLQSVAEATPGMIAELTGVARPTVNQALLVLMRLKRIERIGQGRGTRYRRIV